MSVLKRIVERSRADLDRRRQLRAEAELLDGLSVSTRDFRGALASPGLSLIAEFKPKSPSRGALRPRDEVEEFARLYEGRAAAMSVLCDEAHFDGGFDLLRRARAACGLPLLCKDFVVDAYQVFEARDAGADAVLLMASVIDDGQIAELSGAAAELGMDALVEVHDDSELERVLGLDCPIVGVNARDLHDLTIDADRLARLVDAVPADRVVVAESGIGVRSDVEAIPDRADAVLIGSAFMAAGDPARKLEELGW
jgi:indole-3-glycerol phosphate synthase